MINVFIILQEVDLVIVLIIIIKECQKIVDFIKFFMRIGLSLMIYKLDKRKFGMFFFKEFFYKNVWLCIVIGFLMMSVILFLIGWFSLFEWFQNFEEGLLSEFSMFNFLWSILGVLMQ